MSYYTLYRKSFLGQTLDASIEDLIDADRLPEDLRVDIMEQFDKSISDILNDKLNNSISFKGHCKVFKQPAPTVRNFQLDNVKFKIDGREVGVDFVNIVACEAQTKEKSATGKKPAEKKKKLVPAKSKKRKNM
jgi:hypothetical protein